jgi:hypothetical protein
MLAIRQKARYFSSYSSFYKAVYAFSRRSYLMVDKSKISRMGTRMTKQILDIFHDEAASTDEAYLTLASVAAYVVSNTADDEIAGFRAFTDYFAQLYGQANDLTIEFFETNERPGPTRIKFSYDKGPVN